MPTDDWDDMLKFDDWSAILKLGRSDPTVHAVLNAMRDMPREMQLSTMVVSLAEQLRKWQDQCVELTRNGMPDVVIAGAHPPWFGPEHSDKVAKFLKLHFDDFFEEETRPVGLIIEEPDGTTTRYTVEKVSASYRRGMSPSLRLKVGPEKQKELHEFPQEGKCSVCGLPQSLTPSGPVCDNGHGGA